MMAGPYWRRSVLILVLVAAPLLAGSQCAFFFSSGDSSPDKEEEEDKQAIVVASGILGAVPVAGVSYVSGSLSGITGIHGEFQYEVDQPVQFSIGEIDLGRAVAGKAVITPEDLAAADTVDTTAVVNIQRLLQSLDAEPGDDRITIPDSARARAVQSNELLSQAIEYLDFSDDDAFANAASQLVSVLTSDYPFTGVLVDAETALKTLQKPNRATAAGQ